MNGSPFVVGIGGTISPGSSTERVLAHALRSGEAAGARTKMFGGVILASLAHYGWPTPLGATINTSGGFSSKDGRFGDGVSTQLDMIGRQVCEFAALRRIGAEGAHQEEKLQ